MAKYNADTITEMVKAAGFKCYVEQTGGGCATIYAGETHEEPDYGTRHAVLAGPGAFGWGQEPSVFDDGELWIGPDDDGQSATMDAIALGCRNERDVADLIIAFLRKGRVLSADEAGALGFDATLKGVDRIETVESYADAIMARVDADMREDPPLREFRVFADLHDWCDANEYMIQARVPYDPDSPDVMAFYVSVQDAITERLEARSLAEREARMAQLIEKLAKATSDVAAYWDANFPGDHFTPETGYPFSESLDEVELRVQAWAEEASRRVKSTAHPIP